MKSIQVNQETQRALKLVEEERLRQHGLWGEQNHSMGDWLSILGEEVGECCKAHNENDMDQLSIELTHVAAVSVQINEKIKEGNVR